MVTIAARNDFDVSINGGEAHRILTSWLILHVVGGQVLLPILFATFIFTRAKRHAILVNLTVTWIITSTIALLVFYGGKSAYDQPEAAGEQGVCRAQAAMMQHAVPPMNAMSAFALIYHVWLTVRTSPQTELPRAFEWLRKLRTPILVGAPYLILAIFSIAGGISVSNNPDGVSLVRRKLYCALDHSTISKVVAGTAALILLATVFFQARIVLALRRNATDQREAGVGDSYERKLLVRVMIFGVYVLVGFALSIMSVFVSTVAPDMFISTVPVVIFLVFGCQRDVLTAWCFWKPPPARTPSRTSSSDPRMKMEDFA